MSGYRHPALFLIAAGIISLAGCAQYSLSFPSDDAGLSGQAATTLRGTLLRPQGDGPFPALVLLPGCGILYNRVGEPRPHAREWAWRLREQGYVVLLVDSFSPRGRMRGCVPGDGDIRPGVERVQDAYGALAVLRARKDVMPDRIGLLGWSHGAVAALAAVSDGAPLAARTAAPGAFRMVAAFYPACRAALRGDWRPRVPVLLLLGGSDELTPAGPCLALAERANSVGPTIQVALYDGAAHGFDAPGWRGRFPRGRADSRARGGAIVPDPAARRAAIEHLAAYTALHLKD
jgi:dienelactone hydrolase